MKSKCRKCLDELSEKISCNKFCKISYQNLFKIINILIDLVFVIFHCVVNDEDCYIRCANILKFLATSITNIIEIFQDLFWYSFCYLCSKEVSKEDLAIETVNEEYKEKIKKLRREKKALKNLYDEHQKKETNLKK